MKKYPFYLKFWFMWLVLTAVYVGSYIGLLSNENLPYAKLTFFIGLFVPFGIWNTLALVGAFTESQFVIPSAILLVVLLIFADKLAERMNITNAVSKIVFNLVLLLIITVIVDISIYGQWMSIQLFLENGTNRFW